MSARLTTRKNLFVRRKRPPGRTQARRGAAVVELAILTPFLAILLLGICEVGQAMRVEAVLATAARSACAIASSPAGTNAAALAEATTILDKANLPAGDMTVLISVNDAIGDAFNAVPNDKITVTVKLPTSATRTLATSYYSSASAYHIETVSMLRQ
jgi:Flp pilus assembly protein TadG